MKKGIIIGLGVIAVGALAYGIKCYMSKEDEVETLQDVNPEVEELTKETDEIIGEETKEEVGA